jgi:hypothetical protein
MPIEFIEGALSKPEKRLDVYVEAREERGLKGKPQSIERQGQPSCWAHRTSGMVFALAVRGESGRSAALYSFCPGSLNLWEAIRDRRS